MSSPDLHHVVFFRWKPGTPQDQLAGLDAAAQQMARRAEGVAEFASGANIAGGEWDYALTATFRTVEDFAVYSDDPEHRAFLETWTAPLIDRADVVQFWA